MKIYPKLTRAAAQWVLQEMLRTGNRPSEIIETWDATTHPPYAHSYKTRRRLHSNTVRAIM